MRNKLEISRFSLILNNHGLRITECQICQQCEDAYLTKRES